ncbi:MAG: ABC transporter permease subunit [Patescibacteria group bacterium]
MNLQKAAVIAKNTFTETIRERILYVTLAFAAVTIIATLLAGSISLGQDLRVIQSFGLTAMLVFLLVIAVFVGAQMLQRETDRKTIYLTLSKPVSRETFYLGKFAGFCSVLAVCGGIMAAVLIGLLWIKSGSFPTAAVWATAAIILEAWLITALGMLFGSFATSLMSVIYTFGLIIIGHSATTLYIISQKSAPAVGYLLQTVYYLFPNLEKFNLRNDVVYALTPDFSQALGIVGYFVGYTALLLVLGVLVFRRHES